ncbi:MAG: Dabb family protein [Bacteroidetes bacterium]|nr:Dabb family protein [Bacteroidota bacterium]
MKKHLITILPLFVLLSVFQSCNNSAALEEQLKATQEKLTTTEQALDSIQNQQPGFIHTVFFWFKEGVSEEEKQGFIKSLNVLSEIETVRAFYTGPTAGTPREVVDNSYDYSLIIHFDDKEGHDIYQAHEKHQSMVESQKNVWDRVRVYDTLVK